MTNELLIKFLNKACENPGFVFDYKRVQENLDISNDELQSFRDFLLKHQLVRETQRDYDLCTQCSENARIVDVEKGILKCPRGHQSNIEPIFLFELSLLDENIAMFLKKQLKLTDVNCDKEVYRNLGLHFISSLQDNEMEIRFIMVLTQIDIKDLYALSGSKLTNDGMNILIYNAQLVTSQIKTYLNLIPSLKIVPFADALNNEAKAIIKNIPSSDIEKVKVQNWLKSKYELTTEIMRPESFLEALSFSHAIVQEACKSATQGNEKEFEQYVHVLFASCGMYVTPFGTGEVFDGLIDILEESGKGIKLLFYDAKSVGSKENPATTKKISQTDEDEFSRYAEMFNGIPTSSGRLYGGCFIANDFDLKNMLLKIKQLRSRHTGKVDNSVKIICIPLETLIVLYTEINKVKVDFTRRFKSHHLFKFFGEALTAPEIEQLKKDTKYRMYMQVISSNQNAIYLIPAFVKIFVNYVLQKQPDNIGTVIHINEKSKEALGN